MTPLRLPPNRISGSFTDKYGKNLQHRCESNVLQVVHHVVAMFLFPGPSIELFDDTSFASLFEHQAGTQPIHHPDDTLHLDQSANGC